MSLLIRPGWMTDVLSRETVGRAKLFDVIRIVSERVYLVRRQTEPFYIWLAFRCGSLIASPIVLLLRLSSTAANAGGLLAWEPFCLVLRAGGVSKVAELSAKFFCLGAKGPDGVLSMFPEFRICVPGGQVKGKVQDDLVVRCRKQSLEDRYPTLETVSAVFQCWPRDRTCLYDVLKSPCSHFR